MPKKNGFFVFMTKRKSEMEAAGTTVTGGLKEVAQLVDLEWRELPEAEKESYKEMAKAFNENARVQAGLSPLQQPEGPSASSSGKRNAHGQSVDALQKEARDAAVTEEETRKLLAKWTSEQTAGSIPIVLVNFSCYDDSPGEAVVPAEVALCVFSVQRGVYDNYSSLIDPRTSSPKIQKRAKKLALPQPNYDERLQNYEEIYKDVGCFIENHSKSSCGQSYLFCLDKDVQTISTCMDWLFRKVGEGFISYRLVSLELLIQHISCLGYSEKLNSDVTASLERFHLTSPGSAEGGMDLSDSDDEDGESAVKKVSKQRGKFDVTGCYVAKPGRFPFIQKGVFFHPSHVSLFLQADSFAYHEELACLYHMERRDGVYFCSMNVVNRYAFSLLDVLIRNFGVRPISGAHYPRMDMPALECSRRRALLKPWAVVNYSDLAYDEKALDVDLIEADKVFMRPTASKRHKRPSSDDPGEHSD